MPYSPGVKFDSRVLYEGLDRAGTAVSEGMQRREQQVGSAELADYLLGNGPPPGATGRAMLGQYLFSNQPQLARDAEEIKARKETQVGSAELADYLLGGAKPASSGGRAALGSYLFGGNDVERAYKKKQVDWEGPSTSVRSVPATNVGGVRTPGGTIINTQTGPMSGNGTFLPDEVEIINEMRGKPMIDPRTGKAVGFYDEKGNAQRDPDRLPVKPSVEDGFAKRMQASEAVMSELFNVQAKDEKGEVIPPEVVATSSFDPTDRIRLGIPDSIKSPERKRFEGAQDNWIAALLRRESGAAIAEDEYVNARKQYFPAQGDNGKVLLDKANLRRIAMENMSGGAGIPGLDDDPAGPLPVKGGPAAPSQRHAVVVTDDKQYATLPPGAFYRQEPGGKLYQKQ